MEPRMAVARALLSVSDKSGIVEFARGLSALGIELLSTGGTAALLAREGVKVTQVQDFTGAPEMLGGRVKTLHPKVHGGILARRELASDQADMKAQGILPIDLVVVNLYPFREAVAKGLPFDEVIENIDIGGLSEQLAAQNKEEASGFGESPALPEYRLKQALRYGENPHQRAAFYAAVPPPAEPTLAMARQIQGKELSYNNLLDGAAALEAVKEHAHGRGGQATAVVVKHTNPCGVARASTVLDAYRGARDADPVSAFGGIVALTHPVDAATGAALSETFLEAVIAPGFDPGALEALKGKKALRLLELPSLSEGRESWRPELREMRSIPGGLLVQSRDLQGADARGWKVVTRRSPTAEELEALQFAWLVVKHVESNAIVLAHRDVTVGIGMGQTNRVDSVRIAAERAGPRAQGAALGSDAFFPFPDGVEAAAEAGVAS